MNTVAYLLIGGYAAAHAVRAIRERDTQGTILLVNNEDHLPYERPPLSKDALFDENTTPPKTEVFPRDWYEKNKVQLQLKTRVTQIDAENQTITLDNGETVGYQQLLLAPGAEAKKPELGGADFSNIYQIRKWADIEKLREAMSKANRAVIIGGSYLGLEAASGCLKRGLDVTVIDSHPGPWSKFASPELQKFIQTQYEQKGAKFVFNQKVEKITGTDKAEGVEVEGQTIPCDFMIAATGATLNTELAKSAGLEIDPKNGVVVDEHQRTSNPSIFVAGDCACFHDPTLDRRWHVEHYENALWQGSIAGANMAGDDQKFDHAPYFFSDFLDLHMVLRGDPQGGKNTKVIGGMESGEFVQLYANDEGVVKMILTITHDKPKSEKVAQDLEPLVRANRPLESFQKGDFGGFFAA